MLVLWVLTLIVAPIVSRILAMAVSRKREFLADATGAQFTRNPLALASALQKLEAAASPTRAITRGAAHLCIVDPAPGFFSSRHGFVAEALASHPPIASGSRGSTPWAISMPGEEISSASATISSVNRAGSNGSSTTGRRRRPCAAAPSPATSAASR